MQFNVFVLFACTIITVESVNLDLLEQNDDYNEHHLATVVFSLINQENNFNRTTINLITSETNVFKDGALRIIKLLSASVAVRLEDIKNIQDIKKRKRFSNVFMIDSQEKFAELVQVLSADQFNFDGYFLFVVTNGNITELETVLISLWKVYIYNVMVILQDNDFISLITFVPFNKKHCGDTTPVIVNQHINGSFVKSTRNIFKQKFLNLYNCPVKIGAFENPPSVLWKQYANRTYYFDGNDVELMNEMSRVMKFRKQFNFAVERSGMGKVFENGTSTGTIKKVINGDVDLMMGNLFLTSDRMKFMTNSQSYSSMPLILIVPPGAPFTSFEKLFNPFQATVWFCLLAAFGFGIFVIFIINYQSDNVQRFVFGGGIRYHYMNMLLIIVGGSQIKLPRNNFARSLLMMFLLFCLVQRTLHQGSLYQFLQSDERSAIVPSIDAMISRNFEFFLFATYEEFTRSSKIYTRQKIIDFKYIADYEKNILDPAFKGAIITSLALTAYKNEVINNKVPVLICKEQLMSLPQVLYFQKNHYLVLTFNQKISMLNAAGLVDYWTKKYTKMKYVYGIQPAKVPRNLNISQLYGGFQIWLGGLAIGTVIFVREYFWKRELQIRNVIDAK